jgi:CHAD domain-containing protein/HD superfamily phosphodiesterase
MDPELPLHAASLAPIKPRSKPKVGLRAWMLRVLEECDRAAVDFAADPVHDLRVAIRRCRSLADGLMPIDPDPNWREMKKAAKKLFAALGGLRDMQVMMEWVDRLAPPDDPAAVNLIAFARAQETRLRHDARTELDRFDRKAWRQWSSTLPSRSSVLRPGNIIFKHLALERWTQAYELHRRAMRGRSAAALHQTRIGIKHFRYTVENFLPRQHAAWSTDLKQIQDLLGEVHDLDVLWHTALQIHAFADPEVRTRWHQKILEERARRLTLYRERMTGKQALWHHWRSQLPQSGQIQSAALSRLKAWASFLDSDFAHSRHVANLALELFRGLASHELIPTRHERNLPLILQIAALSHDVGRSRKQRNHPKASAKMLRKMQPPLGWNAHDLKLAAIVVRHQDGAFPTSRHKANRGLELADRRTVTLLAGILHIARALDEDRSGRVTQLMVEQRNRQLLIYARGYSQTSTIAQKVAAARYLLETTLRRSILVRPLRTKVKPRSRQRQVQESSAKPRPKLVA